jgi:hypothetical protein
MNITEQKRIIDRLSVEYIEVEESKISVVKQYIAEEIKKLAYEFVIDYAIINGLALKGFDFKRYKSDNDYIWYDELLKVLETQKGLPKEARDEVISLELSYLFEYLQYKFRNVEL